MVYRSPRRARGAFVTVLLLLALGMAVVLAFQAEQAAASHRAQADRILSDYARLAAARFAQRIDQEMYYYAFTPLLSKLVRAPAGALPTPAKLAAGLDQPATSFLSLTRYTFRVDVHTRDLILAGTDPGAEVRRWLADTLAGAVNNPWMLNDPEGSTVLVGNWMGRPRAIAVMVQSMIGDHARVLVGVEADPRALEPFYTMDHDKYPLLPRPLTGGVIYDSLGSLLVQDARGTTLYRSPVQYPSHYVARDSLDPLMGGLQVEVALRPEIASKLIIGGLPPSRLPLILLLLGLTTLLIVAALVQLHREYELSRLRADFVSGVSHELRTPLAQIRMFSETLLLGRVRSDDERQRSLEIIDQEARRLSHLVENLLHFARSERRGRGPGFEPVRLDEVVREVAEAFTPIATARGTALRTDLRSPVTANADPGAVRQMLINLLDNAVKYGPAGQTVTVGVGLAADQVRLWVEDQGPGIPGDDRDRVWERFWRLERDRGSPVAGTGIGLAVVRELALLHNGRAWIEEGPTGGARVLIEFPCTPPPAEPALAPSPRTAT